MLQQASPSPLHLPAALDLATADGLYRNLVERLNDGDITIDGASVERVGTPCLQVLAVACATARDHQRKFLLLHASVALQAAIADLGLDAAIPYEA